MTKFLDKSFSSRPASREYRDNWDETFGKKKDAPPAEKRETMHKYVGPHGGDLYQAFVRCEECGNGRFHSLHINYDEGTERWQR